MPAIGRVFFVDELIKRAGDNGREMTPAEAIFVLKDFARRGLVVPVGDGGWSVTELGADESAAFNGFSMGASYAPPLTWERFLDKKGTPGARAQVQADFERRHAAWVADELGEDASNRVEAELVQARAVAAAKTNSCTAMQDQPEIVDRDLRFGELISDISSVLAERGECSCDELATVLGRRRAHVLSDLREHPNVFVHNGYGGAHSRWALVGAQGRVGDGLGSSETPSGCSDTGSHSERLRSVSAEKVA